MMWYYILMGIVQGLTEWLPISSSGHLVLLQSFFAVQERTLFDAVLHLGTFSAALVYFREDVLRLLDFRNPLARNVVLASLPILFVGFFLRGFVESAFSSVSLVALLLVFNGFILILNMFARERHAKINQRTSLFVGLVQCFALLPGISRSGITITFARLLGVRWEEAAKFSFFISFIPLAAAACYKLVTASSAFDPFYLLGFVVSFVVGYLTIGVLLRALKTRKFHYFGLYTILLGGLLLA